MIVVLLIALLLPSWAQATNYYISPSGNNSNDGLSTGAPFLTFAHAINASRAWCGDTLILINGTYGDGTSTGRLNINGVVCPAGDELIVQAQNQRKAKIEGTTGSGKTVWVQSSAYIILDGLYARGADNAAVTASENGLPIQVRSSSHITVKNGVWANVNRYGNNAATGTYFSTDVLWEDNEVYIFNRHCHTAWHSERVVVRRMYCNPRDGMLSGGVGPEVGAADAVMSMYPCKDCILENSIADGVTAQMYLAELNPTFGSSVLLENSKILGSLCIRCRSNGVFLDARGTGTNFVTYNAVVRDVAFINYTSASSAIRASDAANALIEHVTIDGVDGPEDAMTADDQDDGTTGAQQSIIIRNVSVKDVDRAFYRESGSYDGSWLGTNVNAFSSATNFSGSPWTNTTTLDPGYGTCAGLWAPDASPLKGAGSGGSDIGATILYRYVDGVLTTAPLWDPTTGEFPHGDADSDGVNRVAGNSLFDIHTRLNVGTGGCAFPAGYGMSGGGDPSTVVRGTVASSGTSATASPLTWNHTVASGQNLLLVCVGMYHSGASVGSVSGIDVSGQAMTLVRRQVTSPDAYRAVEMWKLASPTSGSRTITATLTGSISGALGRSIEFDDTDGTNTATGGSTAGPSTSLSVTAATNANERVEDCTASSKSVTYTHGEDQTGDTDLDHATQSLRLATSTQHGSDGGVMSNSTGGTVYQAKVAVSLMASPEDPPTGSTFTISNYRIDTLHGTAGTPEVTLGPLAAQNTPGQIGATGEFRLRAEILVGVATSAATGVALYCKKVGGSFLRVANSFGSGFVRFYGPGAEPTIPSTLTPTTQRFTGTFAAGRTQRDETLALVIPVMPSGTRTEVDYQLAAGNGLAAGDVLECEIRRDDGTTLGTHTQPMQVNVVGPRASFGF